MSLNVNWIASEIKFELTTNRFRIEFGLSLCGLKAKLSEILALSSRNPCKILHHQHLNLWLFLCASVVIAQEAVSEKQSPLYTVLEKCVRFLVAMDIIDEQTTLFVFQYLEVAELLMAGIVSKYWFNLSSMVRVWYWIFHHDKYLTILILIENFNRHRTSFGTHCGKVLTLYPQYSQLKLEAKKCLIW